MKKLLCALDALVLLLSLTACGWQEWAFLYVMNLDNDDRAPKEEIFSYVRENEDILMQSIQAEDYSSIENKSVVKSVSPASDSVDFYCGGAGFGPNTAYRGFYYSENDDMTVMYPSAVLRPSGAGYEWHGDGDNAYYTEHICGHFYYYELSF